MFSIYLNKPEVTTPIDFDNLFSKSFELVDDKIYPVDSIYGYDNYSTDIYSHITGHIYNFQHDVNLPLLSVNLDKLPTSIAEDTSKLSTSIKYIATLPIEANDLAYKIDIPKLKNSYGRSGNKNNAYDLKDVKKFAVGLGISINQVTKEVLINKILEKINLITKTN